MSSCASELVASFSKLLKEAAQPTVFGDGSQTRDYIHVADVARAFADALDSGEPGVFNVGTGFETDVLVLLRHLQDAAGTSVEPRFEPLRRGEHPTTPSTRRWPEPARRRVSAQSGSSGR